MGVLVGRETAPVEFDTGWFQERLAVIFDNSEITETVSQKPELDFYAALQKSNLKEDYDLKIRKSPVSENKAGEKSVAILENISVDMASGELQSPLKKSRKSMTKLVDKQITSSMKIEPVAKSEVAKPAAVKSDKEKTFNKLNETKFPGQDTSQLPEAKSEQVKEYAGKVYSYTIQIASFNSELDAMNHIAKLGAQGYSAYKSSGMVGDRAWYRIRIGNFNNITEARENLKKLESSGIKGLIIQKD